MSDLIQVLQVVLETTTEPGDTVAVHVPSYPPFLASIERAGRQILPLPIGRELDLDVHRELIRHHRPSLLLLVNPHNPSGRAFRRAELVGLAELAVEGQIPVLADEIHAELAYAPNKHVPFASLGTDVAALTITATSVTKAFNLAGTRCAVAHVGHSATAEALDRAPLDYFGTPSVLSRIAAVAAWREADDWHANLMRLLEANRTRVAGWVGSRGDLTAELPEATYLMWIDFSGSRVAHDPAGELLRTARVRLSPGPEFVQFTDVSAGPFARLNFATTSATLDTVLGRLDEALG